MTQTDHDILDEQQDAADGVCRLFVGAHDTRAPLADFECPHGYVFDGPCACFQLYRVDER
jgi:hypothetical protein